MSQRDQHDLVDAVIAGIRLKGSESEPKMTAFRIPKQVRAQLEQVATAYQVWKTDVVVQSLKTILPQLLRRIDQRQVATAPTTSIETGISDLELLEEIRWEHRTW
jgi:hypothetical protein